jgi:hypothetical protein
MKVLFLDFDGVLIPISPVSYSEDYPTLSRDAIDNLNVLVQTTGAKVIVSSAWRIGRSVRQLDRLLKSWGATFNVFDKTDERSDFDRGREVAEWLAALHTVEAFAVIDDEPTDLQELAHHLVLPNPQVGLQWHDVELAVRILNGAA